MAALAGGFLPRKETIPFDIFLPDFPPPEAETGAMNEKTQDLTMQRNRAYREPGAAGSNKHTRNL